MRLFKRAGDQLVEIRSEEGQDLRGCWRGIWRK
jgi:hypothetical protein